MAQTKEEQLEYARKYRKEHPEQMKIWAKRSYLKHRDVRNKRMKEHYQKNKKQYHLRCEKLRQIYYKQWEGFIPLITNCQVCGKEIYFNRKNMMLSIHFDHRNGGIEKIRHPSYWLYTHKKSEKNEKIWRDCHFGMLCVGCNRLLPTKNREQYLENITRYIKGGI